MPLDRQASIEQFSINVPVSKFFFPQTFSISQADRFNWEPFFFPCQRRGIAHFTKKDRDRQNFWGKHDFPSFRYMTKRTLSLIKTIHSEDFFAPSRYFIQVLTNLTICTVYTIYGPERQTFQVSAKQHS